MCVFCKIINKEIPSKIRYEDDRMMIIEDISPQAKLHFLLLPKEHFANIIEMSEAQSLQLGRCLKKLSELVPILGLEGGFRLISNCGANACQTVEHLHIHILGGEQMAEKMI